MTYFNSISHSLSLSLSFYLFSFSLFPLGMSKCVCLESPLSLPLLPVVLTVNWFFHHHFHFNFTSRFCSLIYEVTHILVASYPPTTLPFSKRTSIQFFKNHALMIPKYPPQHFKRFKQCLQENPF